MSAHFTRLPVVLASAALRPALAAAALALGLCALGLPAPGSAQWVWKDEAGHVVASDQPPPMSVPQSRIVKEPKSRTAASVAPAAAPDAPGTDVKSLADRDLESKQKAKEAADVAKKADDESRRTLAMQENCRQVKANVVALQAGGRAARFNEKGEKVYVDDTERANEINRQQAQASQYCK